MTIFNIFSMLGGLGLFLFGMNMASNHLEIAAGNRMKSVLEKLTANRFVAVLIGAIITAIIQSSSAVTVMVVGFVNSGIMTLESAVWIIMGANIGTTITSQIIAFKITDYAPIILFFGAIMYMFVKNQKIKATGGIICGLGMLFLGMETMSSAMAPLKDIPSFVNILVKFQNPLIGILVGAIFTAIVQSSSASIGVLQALALSNTITLPSAIYVLFGQNIGTCITALIASIGTNRNAKRVTILHLSFNIIGTIVFVMISMLLPFTSWMQMLSPNNVASQIANTHTIFNVVTTLLLLPVGDQLVKLSYMLLPETKVEDDNQMKLKYIDLNVKPSEYRMGTSTIFITSSYKEIQNMIQQVRENVVNAFEIIKDYNEDIYKQILKKEIYIDYLNEKITEYAINISMGELSEEGVRAVAMFISIVSNVERIGEHAVHIANRAKLLHDNQRSFSRNAKIEIDKMEMLCTQVLDELSNTNATHLASIIDSVDVIEDNINKTNNEFSEKQMLRLQSGECTIENSVLFTKVLTDYKRIGDRCLDIAKSIYTLRVSLVNIKNKEV